MNRHLNKKAFYAFFLLVLLTAIAFRIYKADYTGIIHDEAFTYFHFGSSITKALSPMPRTYENFHVLSSILEYYTGKYFRGYEHFIRIPHLAGGIILSLSLAYIICKTIRQNVLRVTLLAAVLFHYYLFDLSFLARGYALALGAIYAWISFTIWLLKKKIKYRYRWVPIIALALMNFIAFGSVVSTVWILAAINFLFIFFYSPDVFTNPPNRRNPVILHLVLVTLLFFVGMYALLKDIYKDILFAGGRYTDRSFFGYMKMFLVDMFVDYNNKFTIAVYCGLILLLAFCLIFRIYQLIGKLRKSTFKVHLARDDAGAFIVLITLTTILVMFVYQTFFKMSLGYMRNGMVLFPLIFLTVGILFDRTSRNITNALWRRILYASINIIVPLLTLQTLPSAYAVQVDKCDRNSISGPLIRKLNAIDPQRTWKIALTKRLEFASMPLRYYGQFGYKYRLVGADDYDVLVFYKTEKLEAPLYFYRDYFSEFNCLVAIGPDFPREKISLDGRSKHELAEKERKTMRILN